ncbi:MAG: hypothetical protein IJZ85_10630 [Lachnospiraceae bacterium]|nr:hypothetical protein [Lachnospiraceae bacterium]
MNKSDHFIVSFAGLTIGFRLPEPIVIPPALSAFLCEESADTQPKSAMGEGSGIVSNMGRRRPEVEYRVELLREPLNLTEVPVESYNGMQVYRRESGWLRVYTPLTAADGCQVACLTTAAGKNTLYYPASKWSFYAKELRILHLIGIEEILLRYEAFLLHSSVVKKDGHMVLFSGPSGAGKSTQASLWEKYLGAEVINGDRCIIRKMGDSFWGAGSPWCGTSAIYRNEMAPLKGIFILGQAEKNSVRRIKAEAFINIYQQCIVNEWASEFVVALSDLIAQLLGQIPVYELNCRPDQDAVRLAYNTLFEGGI